MPSRYLGGRRSKPWWDKPLAPWLVVMLLAALAAASALLFHGAL